MDSNIYQRAESFFPWNLQDLVFNSTIFPYWSKDALYYFQESAIKKLLVRVDIHTGKKEIVFDYQKLLDALSHQLKQKNIQSIPLDRFSIQENPRRLCFSCENIEWHYNLDANTLIKSEKNESYSIKIA